MIIYIIIILWKEHQSHSKVAKISHGILPLSKYMIPNRTNGLFHSDKYHLFVNEKGINIVHAF